MTTTSELPNGLCASEDKGARSKDEILETPQVLAYRINDFAKAIGVGRTTIYKLIGEGKVRPIKIAGRVLIPAREAARLVRDSGLAE